MIIEDNKNAFETALRENIKRSGVEELLDWIAATDFYTAPASTKYHGNYPGGLVEHSLNVFRRLIRKTDEIPGVNKTERIAVVALLHDLCKANFYAQKASWEENGKRIYKYGYENQLPIGHGEKSVILIQRYMQLTHEEIVAISWHMGQFDVRAKALPYELSQAWERYPLAFLLHIADMEATWLDEH